MSSFQDLIKGEKPILVDFMLTGVLQSDEPILKW